MARGRRRAVGFRELAAGTGYSADQQPNRLPIIYRGNETGRRSRAQRPATTGVGGAGSPRGQHNPPPDFPLVSSTGRRCVRLALRRVAQSRPALWMRSSPTDCARAVEDYGRGCRRDPELRRLNTRSAYRVADRYR